MNLNECLFIGRLTRDPETRSFASGGTVATFGMAVNNRKKNQTTGEWEDDPLFLDVDCFKQVADFVGQHLRKGDQVLAKGSLKMDRWTTSDGQKREKVKLTAFNIQGMGKKADTARAVQDEYLGKPHEPAPQPQEELPF